jgi:hypothetical protein
VDDGKGLHQPQQLTGSYPSSRLLDFTERMLLSRPII